MTLRKIQLKLQRSQRAELEREWELQSGATNRSHEPET